MTEYRTARADEYEKCLDFANYVFSNAARPHDFKSLLPKTYRDEKSFARVPHFIALRDDGSIRGMVALRDTPLSFGGRTLSCGFVGTVSVHPYARGEGHMKANMKNMLEYAENKGLDMLVLGGQRQRYGYFGFENGGLAQEFKITAVNIRHCCAELDISHIVFSEIGFKEDSDYAFSLYDKGFIKAVRDKEAFSDHLKTWNCKAFIIEEDGRRLGYLTIPLNEIVLEDENELPRVIKAAFAVHGIKSAAIRCGLHEKARLKLLGGICETSGIVPVEMIKVLNWRKVLEVLLLCKAQLMRLDDGKIGFAVDEQDFTIEVADGMPSVTEGAVNPVRLSGSEAVRLFMGHGELFAPSGILPHSWSALPFFISETDGF